MGNRRVLVTGGTGFIGSHLCRHLSAEGAEVHVLARPTSSTFRLEPLSDAGRVRVERADITSRSAVLDAVAGIRPDLVFHLAASGVRAGNEDWPNLVRVNVEGSLALVDACAQSSVSRIVWLGSGFEYAPAPTPIDESAPIEPLTRYAASKAASWSLSRFAAAEAEVEFVTARLFSAFGPEEHPSRFVPHVITTGLTSRPIEMTSGEQQRDYLFVEDAVRALSLLGDVADVDGETFNLGSGEPRSVREVAETIVKLLPHGGDLRAGAISRRRAEAEVLVADARKMRRLGWKPLVSLEEGLASTIEWYDRNRTRWGDIP